MKRGCLLLMGFLLTLFSSAEGVLKEPKLLILIIASDELEIYRQDQKIWRSYMHAYPDQVEAYFIKSSPYLSAEFLIEEDVIWIREEETLKPGILNKTLKAFEIFLPRLSQEFDFVLRTNLSSFFVMPRLLTSLNKYRKTGLYTSGGGNFHYGQTTRKWGHGCGFILSCDLVELLIKNQSSLCNRIDLADDELIGDFLLREKGYFLFDTPRLDLLNRSDWEKNRAAINPHLFHFRVKNHDHPERRLIDDLFIYKELMHLFYPSIKWPCNAE